MANLDQAVVNVIDQRHPDSDEEALFDELENDDSALTSIREARMQQLAQELSHERHMRSNSYGTYQEIGDEKQLMDITTREAKHAVIHFYKPDFNRCRIMDTHLEDLATRHFDTRFLKINVDHCPFLVAKLKIQMLPCVIAFVEGVSSDRIIGFEGLSSVQSPDKFYTKDLEARLLRAGVLTRPRAFCGKDETVGRSRNKAIKSSVNNEDDDDWD